jgi:outer membrane putative beta-barrel porin/alpha-amylase
MPYQIRLLPLSVILCVLFVCSWRADAQTATSATGLTPRQVLVQLTNAAGDGGGVTNVGEVIADLVGLEVSTAPIGSSAGGFTFTFDPVTRAFTRAAPSFGPMFGERAITAGEGRASFGVNFIHATYDALDGVDIRDGSLQTVVLRSGSTPLFTGAARLNITTDTLVLFTNIALNSWFDAGLAVPYVNLRIDGTHGIADRAAAGNASAAGLGDVALRAKIRLYPHEQGGVALGVDLRVPTGDTDAMLGTGITRTLVSGIWSTTVGTLAPHASFGFEYWSNPFQAYDPLQQSSVDAGRHGNAYDAGVEWTLTDRLTVNGEFMGRTIRNGGRLAYRDLPLRGNAFGLTSASVATVDPRGLHRASVAGGIKWNFTGTALLTANVMLPLNDAGLRDRLTPIIGLDWGF